MKTLEMEAREIIQPAVKAGFDTEDEIIEMTVDYLLDEHPDEKSAEIEALVKRLTGEILEDHIAEQVAWIDLTDCDRLDLAFAQLEEKGIVARQNFTCCQSCGHSEIWGEIKDRAKTIGYTFFHEQDTEYVVEGGSLMLAFSSLSKADDDDIAVGKIIVETLQAAGLTVEWDGSFRTRIEITNLDWRKRR